MSRPQTLHGPERGQPHAAPSSSSGTLQLEMYDKRCPVQASTRDMMGCATPISPHHASQALSFGEALRRSNDFDATTPFQKVVPISKATSGDVSGTSSDACTRIAWSNSIEPISPASVASASTERSPLAADVQLEDDGPIYSVGQIKVFRKTQRVIEPLYEARWEIIFPDIFDRVLSKLRRGRFGMRPNKPRALPEIQLMSAGATRDTSTPSVVVVIPKHIKMMQDFLNTDSIVQNLCKPRDGVTVELQILACKGHSMLIGMPGESFRPDAIFSSDSDSDYLSDDEDSVISTDDSDNSDMVHSTTRDSEFNADFLSVLFENRNTYGESNHGLGIRVVTKDGSRFVRGTCGGFLRLEIPNHPPRQVGLLAGHLLEQLEQASNEASRETYETRSIIGDMLYPKSSGEIPRHDWALFDAGKLSFKSAMVNQHTLSIAQTSELPKENTLVTIRTSRGEVTGTLSSSTSGIMLNPDRGFVHIRMVIMHKGSLHQDPLLLASQEHQVIISGANNHLHQNRLSYHERRLRCMGRRQGAGQSIRTYCCNE